MRNPHNDTLSAPGPQDRPARPDKALPERKCILTARHDGRGALVRLAISPDGLVLPDPLARAPGRGAWIGVSRADLEIALANGKLKGALARAFKGAPLTIPADLPDLIEQGLKRATLDRLGIELRAGSLVLGTEKIAQAARSGAIVLLAHASDAKADGVGKLAQAWRVGEEAEGSGMMGRILPLDRAALSVALGRDNVVHLGVTDAGAAERIDGPLARLMHFIGAAAPEGPPGGTPPGEPAPAAAPAAHAANDDLDTKGE
ncbi:DUF448 domain-containing protein [Novosphingobium capsulatum]|uniref:DUF448 domain-containing protein n=1 Tax=Novosphingobium capsulatum TaxID=13688 RepID=UPI000A064F7C|nr:DUF448 domain-containing protein [Novosphingobium capsulatum]WQD91364.1 DUF448 domain-containing protein [Novosphingobium capsulatum]